MKLDILIPVGPGHEELYKRAVDSVRMATVNKGPFDVVSIRAGDDTEGKNGRSKTRNDLAKESDADWLFLLDADDLLHPEAFLAFANYPYLDAMFGTICEMQEGCVRERYQVPEIHDYQTLLAFDPYLTLQMGHFVRREVFEKLKFNEDMDVGEDWDYYLRLWKNFKCEKVKHPLMVNVRGAHSTGPRAASGQQWTQIVSGLIEEARSENRDAA
jgi:hypothetical protein